MKEFLLFLLCLSGQTQTAEGAEQTPTASPDESEFVPASSPVTLPGGSPTELRTSSTPTPHSFSDFFYRWFTPVPAVSPQDQALIDRVLMPHEESSTPTSFTPGVSPALLERVTTLEISQKKQIDVFPKHKPHRRKRVHTAAPGAAAGGGDISRTDVPSHVPRVRSNTDEEVQTEHHRKHKNTDDENTDDEI